MYNKKKQTMRNLLERLKPEYLEMIDKDLEKYPISIKNLKNKMREEFIPCYLSYDTAYVICTYTNTELSYITLNSLFHGS